MNLLLINASRETTIPITHTLLNENHKDKNKKGNCNQVYLVLTSNQSCFEIVIF